MNDVSDNEILRLIEKGETLIQQEEAQRLAKEQAQEAEIRAAWDVVNDELRDRLPVELQPYMRPVYDSYPPEIVNYHDMKIEIPGLAPIQAKIYSKREEGIFYHPSSFYDFNTFEDEPPQVQWFFPHYHYNPHFASLPIILARARRLYVEAHQKFNDYIQAGNRAEPIYEPVADDPILRPAADRLYDLVHEIVNMVIAERD